MLIIEGTDLLGKTTFAKELAKKLAYRGYVYAHFTRLPEGFDYCHHYMQRASRFVVQDRFHMSELAYTYARQDPLPSLLCLEKYRLVDAYLAMLGSFTVILVSENEEHLRARVNRPEMYTPDVIVRANEWFIKASSMLHYSWDMVINLGPHKSYPDEHDVNDVVNAYIDRQLHLERMINARYSKYSEGLLG